ncbi:S-methyl-5-thioribose-1-phosphate isomerase [Clostridium tetani]|uniref:Putative translation initiation factor EIF-2B subunit 1 n=1 Tax=Clostridium tetani (strain Massachusetts / E88) TaxID=212717 RepID=Q896Q3_CLOTE|nr:S-methyl-5-thioribose-1-phosphate isomerase [Clostridium tetani]AAO35537.1 putative translation initiation factor EIF-2B subunit 1 [Clostridium tetani E88]KGI37067.1 methylthioribose-1-phosphate isomerase [Clostridium tetani]KGI46254.1 methylthioribose-1-phosphate isomerase [Clostridium tetani]KHO36370.1 methylthioribose-1-phosphate isomerase [Clostridium tetani]KIG21130.1 methylthioribose-1-phosphate isomerase [Clostridium tetani]
MERSDKDLAFMLRYENVAWYDGGKVKILDRRIYPKEVKFVTCNTHEEVAKAITDMVTQSAGPYTAAGMGMALAAYECRRLSYKEQIEYLENAAYKLANARPTTANRMTLVVKGCLEAAQIAMKNGEKVDQVIFEHTVKSMNNRYSRIGEVAKYLVDMFPQKGNIMTQCFGETIVGMMLKEAKNRNKNIKLFCPETRPYLQGARLTASVAYDQGFDVTVITDNMPAFTMKNKNIDVFTSAADSICLDGHIVNKVGTLQIAIVAKYFEVPYFVTGIPDRDHKSIYQVEIEERDPKQVLEFRGIKNTMEGVKGYYPSFDITPPHLVSGVVTDKGIFSPYDLDRYFQTKVENYY